MLSNPTLSYAKSTKYDTDTENMKCDARSTKSGESSRKRYGIRGRLYEAARSPTTAVEPTRSSTQEAAILDARTFGMFKDAASLDCNFGYFDTDKKKKKMIIIFGLLFG